MSESKDQATLFRELEPVMSAVGKSFAQAFAVYTVEVLRLAQGGAQDLNQSSLRDPVFEGLDGADEWVRQAYKASLRTDVPRMDLQQARSRVAGNKIIRTLRARGMTQADLARKVGMKPASLSRVLKQPDRSRTSTLLKIADALGVDVSNIMA